MALAARAMRVEPRRPNAATGARVRRLRANAASKRLRIFAFVVFPLALVVGYVWLTALLTAQTYRLHDEQQRQVALVQEYHQLRAQVADLESLPRLEAAAAKLHMTVPGRVALVAPARSAPVERHAVLTASIAGIMHWFSAR